MLAKYYRFRALNDTDQTITYNDAGRLDVTWIPYKFTNGILVYGSEVTQEIIASGETIAADAEDEGAVVDNSSDLYLGLKGTFQVIADLTSTDGTVYLYLEESTDNVIWSSDMADFEITDLIFVCAVALSTDAADEGRIKNFEL